MTLDDLIDNFIGEYEDITEDLRGGDTSAQQARIEHHELIEQFKNDLMEFFNA